jgi:hypothetical protein
LGRHGRIDTLDARRGNGGKIVEKFARPIEISPSQISGQAPPIKMIIVSASTALRTRALAALTGWQVNYSMC